MNVVRGENTAFLSTLNLSTRAPTSQRKYFDRKISSCRYAPPSVRLSPFGAIDSANELCRKLPP
jgi:hypothetical protein